ncbi:MAG: diguanylate cyclase [Actinomycetales bacterium]
MDLRAGLEPRDPDAAVRTAGLLVLLGSAVTLFFAVLQPPAGGTAGRLAAIGVSLVLLALSFVLRRMTTTWPVLLWVLTPLLGVATIVALDLATLDASAAGQVFLCLPVLYAAAQLRWLGAGLTTAAAVVGDALVVFRLEPLGPAITDFAYVVATCVTMAAVLVRARSRQEGLVSQLRRAAAIDPLTGLVTRRVLDEAAHAAIVGGANDDGTALVLIDVDRFKSINDTYGHPVGDAVLVHVAEVLATQTRSDTVICRMGGDELAVLLPGCSNEVAVRRAHELLDAVHSHPYLLADGTLIAISVSIGVAQVPTHAAGLEPLYSVADQALYLAKRGGRGRVSAPPPREDASVTRL